MLKQNDDAEEKWLNETANNVSNTQEAIVTISRYEEIIKTQNKKAIGYIGKQGKLLKRFQNTENVFDNISPKRSTKNFKISLFIFLKKSPLLKTSTLQSSCFKNEFKEVVCKGNKTFLCGLNN